MKTFKLLKIYGFKIKSLPFQKILSLVLTGERLQTIKNKSLL